MASLTRDDSGSNEGELEPIDEASPNKSESFNLSKSIRSMPIVVRWVTALAGLAATLLICLVVWGPGMDFPSTITQEQSDGTVKEMQVSRIISAEIKSGTTWLVRNWGGMFDGIDLSITYAMVGLEDGLRWIPWPVAILAIAGIAWIMAGWRLAVFSVSGLAFIGFMNRWDSAVETVAIIIFSVAVSIIVALPLGVLGSRSNRFDSAIRPVLDGMQTMPSYVYLVPGILFFGLGYTPAVIAVVIYAVPPAIRLTNLGIRQVSSETVEAGRSFGASPFQLLTKVQIPMALPTIMAGINQTTMLALSMVVIASLVGASGLGEDVFRALQQQDPGNSVIAGTSIVLIAIIIDRITQAIAKSREESMGTGH